MRRWYSSFQETQSWRMLLTQNSLFFSIYPSQDQDPGGPHIPISNNTGSLPDLTNLHFPPPLITPLDSDDQQQQQQQQTQQQNQQQQNYSAQGSPASLSPTTAHHMNMAPPQQSPVQRRRSPQHTPSPLILGSPTQMRHSVPPQVKPSWIPWVC